MDRFAIVLGLLLCGLTIAGLFASPVKAPLQFIPMMFGIPTLFCGVVSLNPHRRRYAMFQAALLVGFGAIIAMINIAALTVRLVSGGPVNRITFSVVVAMAALCIVFVLTSLFLFQRGRSRKSREDGD